MDYQKIKDHFGHNVVIAQYGEGANFAIECEDCNEVLVDFDRPAEQKCLLPDKTVEDCKNCAFGLDYHFEPDTKCCIERTTPICPLGGDLENNCADCYYSGEFYFDPETKQCTRREAE
jgi:hypothetical protein